MTFTFFHTGINAFFRNFVKSLSLICSKHVFTRFLSKNHDRWEENECAMWKKFHEINFLNNRSSGNWFHIIFFKWVKFLGFSLCICSVTNALISHKNSQILIANCKSFLHFYQFNLSFSRSKLPKRPKIFVKRIIQFLLCYFFSFFRETVEVHFNATWKTEDGI